MRYIYGVEKRFGAWYVWRFLWLNEVEAVAWLARGDKESIRWLCSRETAVEMAGESAMHDDNLIIMEY